MLGAEEGAADPGGHGAGLGRCGRGAGLIVLTGDAVRLVGVVADFVDAGVDGADLGVEALVVHRAGRVPVLEEVDVPAHEAVLGADAIHQRREGQGGGDGAALEGRALEGDRDVLLAVGDADDGDRGGADLLREGVDPVGQARRVRHEEVLTPAEVLAFDRAGRVGRRELLGGARGAGHREVVLAVQIRGRVEAPGVAALEVDPAAVGQVVGQEIDRVRVRGGQIREHIVEALDTEGDEHAADLVEVLEEGDVLDDLDAPVVGLDGVVHRVGEGVGVAPGLVLGIPDDVAVVDEDPEGDVDLGEEAGHAVDFAAQIVGPQGEGPLAELVDVVAAGRVDLDVELLRGRVPLVALDLHPGGGADELEVEAVRVVDVQILDDEVEEGLVVHPHRDGGLVLRGVGEVRGTTLADPDVVQVPVVERVGGLTPDPPGEVGLDAEVARHGRDRVVGPLCVVVLLPRAARELVEGVQRVGACRVPGLLEDVEPQVEIRLGRDVVVVGELLAVHHRHVVVPAPGADAVQGRGDEVAVEVRDRRGPVEALVLVRAQGAVRRALPVALPGVGAQLDEAEADALEPALLGLDVVAVRELLYVGQIEVARGLQRILTEVVHAGIVGAGVVVGLAVPDVLAAEQRDAAARVARGLVRGQVATLPVDAAIAGARVLVRALGVGHAAAGDQVVVAEVALADVLAARVAVRAVAAAGAADAAAALVVVHLVHADAVLTGVQGAAVVVLAVHVERAAARDTDVLALLVDADVRGAGVEVVAVPAVRAAIGDVGEDTRVARAAGPLLAVVLRGVGHEGREVAGEIRGTAVSLPDVLALARAADVAGVLGARLVVVALRVLGAVHHEVVAHVLDALVLGIRVAVVALRHRETALLARGGRIRDVHDALVDRGDADLLGAGVEVVAVVVGVAAVGRLRVGPEVARVGEALVDVAGVAVVALLVGVAALRRGDVDVLADARHAGVVGAPVRVLAVIVGEAAVLDGRVLTLVGGEVAAVRGAGLTVVEAGIRAALALFALAIAGVGEVDALPILAVVEGRRVVRRLLLPDPAGHAVGVGLAALDAEAHLLRVGDLGPLALDGVRVAVGLVARIALVAVRVAVGRVAAEGVVLGALAALVGQAGVHAAGVAIVAIGVGVTAVRVACVRVVAVPHAGDRVDVHAEVVGAVAEVVAVRTLGRGAGAALLAVYELGRVLAEVGRAVGVAGVDGAGLAVVAVSVVEALGAVIVDADLPADALVALAVVLGEAEALDVHEAVDALSVLEVAVPQAGRRRHGVQVVADRVGQVVAELPDRQVDASRRLAVLQLLAVLDHHTAEPVKAGRDVGEGILQVLGIPVGVAAVVGAAVDVAVERAARLGVIPVLGQHHEVHRGGRLRVLDLPGVARAEDQERRVGPRGQPTAGVGVQEAQDVIEHDIGVPPRRDILLIANVHRLLGAARDHEQGSERERCDPGPPIHTTRHHETSSYRPLPRRDATHIADPRSDPRAATGASGGRRRPGVANNMSNSVRHRSAL